jgi:signal transduction histidine kinase
MQMSPMTIALLVVALAAIILAWRLRHALAGARRMADSCEQLAAARGRSLSLAAQELRGIAVAMAGCRKTGPAGPSGRVALCHGPHGISLEGPAQQIMRLADDLAEIAAGSPSRSIRTAPVPLGPVVDAALSSVSGQIRPGIRHWQVEPALRALTVNADRRALQGALAALLRRAASHSRDGDMIALRWVVASETVSIVVEDEGDGLSAPDLMPEATAGPGGTRGLDLGLSLARSLAAAHGGDIRLESAPGIGARAWLTLPRERVLEAA